MVVLRQWQENDKILYDHFQLISNFYILTAKVVITHFIYDDMMMTIDMLRLRTTEPTTPFPPISSHHIIILCSHYKPKVDMFVKFLCQFTINYGFFQNEIRFICGFSYHYIESHATQVVLEVFTSQMIHEYFVWGIRKKKQKRLGTI